MMDSAASAATEHDGGWRELASAHLLPRLLIILLGVWINAADSLVTSTIMPSVSAGLGGYAAFSWAVAGFLIGSVVAGASAGRLAEGFGLGRASSFAGIVFAVGCIASAAAPDMASFLAGRVVQGVGSGWFSGFAMVAIAQLFPPRQLARVFAIISAVWGVATVLGPLLGGLFAAAGQWRAVFWAFAVQAAVFAALAPPLFRQALPGGMSKAVPVLQLLLVTAGIVLIALADMVSGAMAALGVIALGFVLLALVFVADGRARIRLLPHRAGDPRTVIGAAYLAIFALAAAMMPFGIYVPPILQQLKGFSPLQAGYVVGSLALAWTLAAFIVAHVHGDADRRWIRGAALLILLGAVLQWLAMPSLITSFIVASGAVMGAGFGLWSSLLNRRALLHLASEDTAIGSAALITMRQVGGAVGAALAGVAANMAGFAEGLSDHAARAASVAVFVPAIPLALIGVAASFAATRRLAKLPETL